MKKQLFKLLIPALLLPLTATSFADESPGLTLEQKSHEKRLNDLRRQKEILDLNHAKAKLIAECRQMGVDCQGQNITVIEQPVSATDELGIEPFQIPESIGDTTLPSIAGSNSSSNIPTLESIQNQSAQLNLNGASEWALVGDTIGQWKIIHIDATKVRVQSTTQPNKTRTLVLRW